MLRVQVSLAWAVLRDWHLMWDAWRPAVRLKGLWFSCGVRPVRLSQCC